jgi:hypothetical protein
MTLKQLLTHTAGFGLEFFNTEIVQYQAAAGTPGIITCENAALTTPLLFDPGERWGYGINRGCQANCVTIFHTGTRSPNRITN